MQKFEDSYAQLAESVKSQLDEVMTEPDDVERRWSRIRRHRNRARPRRSPSTRAVALVAAARRPQPVARSRRPAAAPRAGAVRARRVRRDRRPGPQEAAACGLRPGQPRPAAGRLRAARLRPPRLGRRRLRGAGQEGGQGPRAHRLEGGRLGAPVGRHHVRPRLVRRRRGLRHAAQDARRPVPVARHQGQRRVLPVHPAEDVPDGAAADGAHRDGRQRAPPAAGAAWSSRSRSGTTCRARWS